MALQLPSHVRGWKIPATERDTELTVIRAETSWGPCYEVGDLNADWTATEPKDLFAWIVEGDTHPGMAILQIEAGARTGHWMHGRRAVAAMLHFCVQAEGPQGSGYMPEGGVLYLPSHTAQKTDDTVVNHLMRVGFYASFARDDHIGRSDRILAYTAEHFPEFAQAEVLPRRTEAEEIDLAVARAAEQAAPQ